ncbi:MAG: DVUA0089 family protein [Anaerolineae bacterium]|nr:DVUA0089 family protein [Anaerolineae bacterium]
MLFSAWALLLAAPARAQSADDGNVALACSPDQYEPDNTPGQAVPVIPNNAPTSHTFNPPGDTDYVRFQAVAGATYVFSTSGLSSGADTVLTLWDQDGATRLLHNDDDPIPGRGLASRIEWIAPASGTYFISVHEFAGNNDCRGYQLSLRMALPERTYVPDTLKNAPAPTATPDGSVCVPARVTSVAVETHPKAVAVGPGRAYVGLYNSASLAVVDTTSNTLLRTVAGAGTGANGIALSGDYVYLAHRDSASVSVFRAADPNSRQLTLTVGILPFGLAALPDRVFVANFGGDSVTVIDSATNTILRTVPVGAQPALAAAGGARGWITALSGGGVQVIDRDGRLVRTVTTGGQPFGIGYNSLRGRLYVSHWSDNTLWAIDAASGLRLNFVTLPDKPFAVAVNPTTGHVFVILAKQNRMLVLREDTLSQIADLPLENQGGDDGGQSVVVYENRVYVADYAAGNLTIFQDAGCTP